MCGSTKPFRAFFQASAVMGQPEKDLFCADRAEENLHDSPHI
jgi:hypothetical protein